MADDILKLDGTYYLSVHGVAGGDWYSSIAYSTDLTTWAELANGPFVDSWGREINNIHIHHRGGERTVLHYYSDAVDMVGIYRAYPAAE